MFVTDQYSMSIRAFNRSNNMAHLRDVPILAIPYDIMVYDEELQEDMPSKSLVPYHISSWCIMGVGGGGGVLLPYTK